MAVIVEATDQRGGGRLLCCVLLLDNSLRGKKKKKKRFFPLLKRARRTDGDATGCHKSQQADIKFFFLSSLLSPVRLYLYIIIIVGFSPTPPLHPIRVQHSRVKRSLVVGGPFIQRILFSHHDASINYFDEQLIIYTHTLTHADRQTSAAAAAAPVREEKGERENIIQSFFFLLLLLSFPLDLSHYHSQGG